MNNEEKKKRMQKVVDALLEEEGLSAMLTDEDKRQLMRRAFKQQVDYALEYLVKRSVDDLMKQEVEASKLVIKEKVAYWIEQNVAAGSWGIVKDEVRSMVRGMIDVTVLNGIRKTLEEMRGKLKVNMNITFGDEEKK